jgi:hypothetical protein
MKEDAEISLSCDEQAGARWRPGRSRELDDPDWRGDGEGKEGRPVFGVGDPDLFDVQGIAWTGISCGRGIGEVTEELRKLNLP